MVIAFFGPQWLVYVGIYRQQCAGLQLCLHGSIVFTGTFHFVDPDSCHHHAQLC